eukprot:1105535-Prymnesium_polylepis.1
MTNESDDASHAQIMSTAAQAQQVLPRRRRVIATLIATPIAIRLPPDLPPDCHVIALIGLPCVLSSECHLSAIGVPSECHLSAI